VNTGRGAVRLYTGAGAACDTGGYDTGGVFHYTAKPLA